MRGLPVGKQLFNNIKFDVVDPGMNDRKAVVALSVMEGYPRQINFPLKKRSAAVYLLHSSSDNLKGDVAGAITFLYADGTEAAQYLMKDKEITNWWFTDLKTERAGVAWSGPNPVCTKVGVCWAVIDNPFPEKEISSLQFHAPLEGGIYALLGLTLADKPFYIAPKGPSYGGPDNWAAANGMAALVEGLAGAKNEGLAFDKVLLSPRWASGHVDSVQATVNLAASKGYVSYHFKNDSLARQIMLTITGSGIQLKLHLLLPTGRVSIVSLIANNKPVNFKIVKVEQSMYVDAELSLATVQDVIVNY